MTVNANNNRTWTCKCGEIKAILKGEPILNFRCHCHSCVAAATYIDSTNNTTGTSILHPDGHGGACASPYASHQVKFITPLSTPEGKSKLKFVRVGKKGQAWRAYTTCCGTQLNNCVFPGMIVLNRNGIQNSDGTPYEPSTKEEEVLNINQSCAFDPDTVPEPRHSTAPFSYAVKFMFPIVNPFSTKFKHPELFPNKNDADIVPITWED